MAARQRSGKKDVARSYEAAKTHGGRRYTGMKVGGHHTWDYEPGVWKEKKVAPDRWDFRYETPKRRRGKAPTGSGAPVGTEYHWYIVAHQMVRKLDANTYSTQMQGTKYKLAHKRATKEEWSARSERARLRRELAILEDAAERIRERLAEDAPKRPGTAARARKEKAQSTLPLTDGRARAHG